MSPSLALKPNTSKPSIFHLSLVPHILDILGLFVSFIFLPLHFCFLVADSPFLSSLGVEELHFINHNS